MTVGDRIQFRRKELNISYQAIAVELNVSKTTVMRYCCGQIKKVPTDLLKQFADILQTDVNWLLGSNDEKLEIDIVVQEHDDLLPLNHKKFPLLGEISCGVPVLVEEMTEHIVACDLINADFCLRAKGDSMINTRIFDGDIVFIKSQNSVENGEIAAVLIDNETTLKRVYYYPENNRILLQAENNKYLPMIYENEQLDDITILGKAVKVMIDL